MIFLGSGNMAMALAKGLLRQSPHLALSFYSPSGASSKKCAEELNQHLLQSLTELKESDIVFLACKPQQFQTLATSLKDLKRPPKRYISIMAGISQTRLLKELPQVPELEVIRLMPALQIGLAPAPSVLFPQTLPDWARDFEKLGPLIRIDEEDKFHLATCLVGSLPGVMAELLAWNTELGIKGGLEESEVVKSLAASMSSLGQAFAQLDPSILGLQKFRNQVTSKAGITEAIIKSFDQQSVAKSWQTAMLAGENRSRELQ